MNSRSFRVHHFLFCVYSVPSSGARLYGALNLPWGSKNFFILNYVCLKWYLEQVDSCSTCDQKLCNKVQTWFYFECSLPKYMFLLFFLCGFWRFFKENTAVAVADPLRWYLPHSHIILSLEMCRESPLPVRACGSVIFLRSRQPSTTERETRIVLIVFVVWNSHTISMKM